MKRLLACLIMAPLLSSCSSSSDSKLNRVALNNAPAHVNTLPTMSSQGTSNAEDHPIKTKGSVAVTLDQAQSSEINLTTQEVKHGFINKTVDAPGKVGPNAELTRVVSTPSAGRATEVRAKLGDYVREGQVMAILKSDPVGQVQSDLLQNTLQARADIKQQEVQLKLSKITYERESTLYKEQVSAKADLQAAENQLEKDEANLQALKAKMDATIKVAQERLNLLGASADSARKVVAQNKIDPWVIIRAPWEGVVIDRQINPGELNDGTKPLFTVADLSQVWLFANIFEKDIADVKKEQQAFVTIDSLPNDKFPAKIIWVGDAVDPTTRTMPVRANVPNADMVLKPNMFARIRISVGQIPVLLIPSSAVLQEGDKTLAFVQTGNGVYQEREIETGIDDGQNTEVVKGLNPGERVVSHGGTALLGAAMKTAEGR